MAALLAAGLDDVERWFVCAACAPARAAGGGADDADLIGHCTFRVLVPAGVLVIVARQPSRTFTTVNMPPISIGPNGPKPVIIGSVLSGSGISISPISAMPAEPIAM